MDVAVAEKTDHLEHDKPTSFDGKSNPVIDDGLLSLLHQDFAREQEQSCEVIEEDIKPAPDPQQVKAREKSYECPHCDFVATGDHNIKLYEEAVKHKKAYHQDVGEQEFISDLCEYKAKDKSFYWVRPEWYERRVWLTFTS